MKNVLKLLCLIILGIQSCSPDKGSIPANDTYYKLTSEQLSVSPYFTNPAFDTISFAGNKGDTLTFVKTKTDTFWKSEKATGNPDDISMNYYQTLRNRYTTIKGSGSFNVSQIIENSSFDFLKIGFNKNIFYVYSYQIANKKLSNYVATINKNNKVFIDCSYNYNQYTDSISAKAFINKAYGVFLIEDRINNQEYLITK